MNSPFFILTNLFKKCYPFPSQWSERHIFFNQLEDEEEEEQPDYPEEDGEAIQEETAEVAEENNPGMKAVVMDFNFMPKYTF